MQLSTGATQAQGARLDAGHLQQTLLKARKMPSASALSEGTLLGLQSSVGLSLAQSLDVKDKMEALVRL